MTVTDEHVKVGGHGEMGAMVLSVQLVGSNIKIICQRTVGSDTHTEGNPSGLA